LHIPDGFINATTSLEAGAIAASGIAVAVRKSSDALDDRGAPMAGLVAAFVFAAQMVNFPVAAGTSGHLIGGVLATVLVGPWAGALCIAVVLLVQALFADGGLTALGLNVINMSLVAGLGGYAVFLAARHLLPSSRGGVAIAAAVAGGASVVLAAGAFVVEFALGGVAPVSVTAVASAMLGVHVLIGIGEAAITGMTVAMVLGIRPDLVYGAPDLRPELMLSRPGRTPVGA
jgi:cobalt/nickel transport system permease protein